MAAEYLRTGFDWEDPYSIHVFDEVSVWSAMFGLMLLEHVPMRAGMRVLDVGCGTGFPLFELRSGWGLPARFTAWTNGMPRPCARIKARLWRTSNVYLAIGDAARMPFGEGLFDLVVSNLGINNFADPAASLRECERVMKAGARIVLTTNLQGHMQEFYEVYRRTLLDMGRSEWIEALDRHVRHRTTVEQTGQLLTGAGLRVCTVREASLPMRFLDGSALLRHWAIRVAFLPAWRKVVSEQEQVAVFVRLEENLNRLAKRQGGLTLTIPAAYIEARKGS